MSSCPTKKLGRVARGKSNKVACSSKFAGRKGVAGTIGGSTNKKFVLLSIDWVCDSCAFLKSLVLLGGRPILKQSKKVTAQDTKCESEN